MNTPVKPDIVTQIRNSQYFKLCLIGILIILLQIPISKIGSVIRERKHTRDGAVGEVTSKWGQTQTLIGPRLVVPYIQRWVEIDKEGVKHPKSRTVHATFLPETLTIGGKIDCQLLHRGIYEVPVYNMVLNLEGDFSRPEFEQWDTDPADILWDRAYLAIGISDSHAIMKRTELFWNDSTIPFIPGMGDFGCGKPGLHARLDNKLNGKEFKFSIPLELNGSMGAYFAPVGKETVVTLESNWEAPSFQGLWLPTERNFEREGFEVSWKIPFLGNFPQSWQGNSGYEETMAKSVFGVNLISPVDQYRMVERSVKYQLLFIFLTFAVLWLFEALVGMKIHPIQYLLVGFGLCLFYLLELSLTEHVGFLGAYLLACVMIILLISFYAQAILKTRGRAAIIGGLITGLYAFLFVLLNIQDYALLVGSLALFAMLAVAMFLTRKINWYNPTGKPSEENQ